MSQQDEATENPNVKQAPGKPLGHDEVASTRAEDERDSANKDKAPAQPIGEDHGTPGGQERPLTSDEKLDKSLEDTFPTSDPVPPSHIDGPNN